MTILVTSLLRYIFPTLLRSHHWSHSLVIHWYPSIVCLPSTILPCCICSALLRIAMAHQCITRITPLCTSHYSSSDTACLLISIHSFICIWVHPPVYPTYTGQCVMHCWWLFYHLLSTLYVTIIIPILIHRTAYLLCIPSLVTHYADLCHTHSVYSIPSLLSHILSVVYSIS